jgi:DNA-directed RNA polymerase sigma subunit (sigma70/sigma32)
LARSEWEMLINEWILNEKERAIMKRKLLDGLTFDELSKEFNYSIQNVQRIYYARLEKLCSKIK